MKIERTFWPNGNIKSQKINDEVRVWAENGEEIEFYFEYITGHAPHIQDDPKYKNQMFLIRKFETALMTFNSIINEGSFIALNDSQPFLEEC